MLTARIKVLIFCICLILFSLSAYAGESDENIYPLVIVNEDTITSKDMDDQILLLHSNSTMADRSKFNYEKLLHKLVNDMLILQEAYMLGIDDNEYLQDYLNNKLHDDARRLYVLRKFKPDLTVPEEEIKNFFDENLKRYQFRTISVYTMEEAEKAYAMLQDGAVFEQLVKEFSKDHLRMKNGLQLVTFKMNVEPVFLELANNMNIGDISKPFKFNNFYTIAKLEQRMPADSLKYDVFRDNIIDKISGEKRAAAWIDFIDQLEQKAKVNINKENIAKITADKEFVLKAEFLKGHDEPVLYIDDDNFISDTELRKEISHSIMNAGTSPFDSLLDISIRTKRDELVSTYFAKKENFTDSSIIVNRYARSLDSAMIELYLKEMIASKITFDREEFVKYYNENIDKFRNQDKYLFKRVKFLQENDAFKASGQLKDGADWNYVISQYEVETYENMDKNWTTLDGYPDNLVEQLTKMNTGETTTPVQYTDGWLILFLNDREKGSVKPIEEVDMQLRSIIFQEKFNALLEKHLNILKNNSNMVYFDSSVNHYFGKKQ